MTFGEGESMISALSTGLYDDRPICLTMLEDLLYNPNSIN